MGRAGGTDSKRTPNFGPSRTSGFTESRASLGSTLPQVYRLDSESTRPSVKESFPGAGRARLRADCARARALQEAMRQRQTAAYQLKKTNMGIENE